MTIKRIVMGRVSHVDEQSCTERFLCVYSVSVTTSCSLGARHSALPALSSCFSLSRRRFCIASCIFLLVFLWTLCRVSLYCINLNISQRPLLAPHPGHFPPLRNIPIDSNPSVKLESRCLSPPVPDLLDFMLLFLVHVEESLSDRVVWSRWGGA